MEQGYKYFNKGFKVLNPTNTNKSGPMTVIVMGVTRNGTSLIAKLLQGLGVFMGFEVDGAMLEDKEIENLLHRPFPQLKFKALVEKRNRLFHVWGWKIPRSFEYLNEIEPIILNPYYIIVFRDVLAISLRNELALGGPFQSYMDRAIKRNAQLIQIINKSKVPTLLVSYEKALLNPEFLVRTLSNFLKIKTLSEEEITNLVSLVRPNPKKYLQAVAASSKAPSLVQSISGYLNSPGNGIITGWIWDKQRPESSLSVKVFANNKLITIQTADLFRPDLVNLGIGTGYYGFRIDLKILLPYSRNPYKISVRYHGNAFMELSDSPAFIEIPREKKEILKNFSKTPDPHFSKLFFMHIPKTGGNSLNHWLLKHFSKSNILTHLEVKSALIPDKLGYAKCLTGHLPILSFRDRYPLSDYLRITMVRDPMSQLVSHLRMVRSLENLDDYGDNIRQISLQLKSLNLSQPENLRNWLDSLPNSRRVLFDNCQTRYFLKNPGLPKLDDIHLEEVTQTLDYFHLVGTIEEVDDFIAKVAWKMEWKSPRKFPRKNVGQTTFGIDPKSSDWSDALEPYIRLDLRLYDMVTQLKY